jgi:hypothetical protein
MTKLAQSNVAEGPSDGLIAGFHDLVGTQVEEGIKPINLETG